MGANNSQLSEIPDLELIIQETGFTKAHICRLYNRFNQLDKEKTGKLTKENFDSLRELAVNPLGERIIKAFFPDGQNSLDFRSFAKILAPFRPIAEGQDSSSAEPINSRNNKLRFAFRLYDEDKDGKISREELFQVLRLMLGSQVSDDQLESITDRTIQEADTNGDQTISFEEFRKVLENVNVEQKMSIRFLR
uniref:Calcineurin B homologous protein 2 n=1 Tax=Callorhinchus milii TaxID=7868 RepID=V9LEI6_CALMI